MIKIENVEVVGWEHAIRGMRNPMNSWDKSDSYIDFGGIPYGLEYRDSIPGSLIIGNNDISLMQKLCKAGTDHRKFMRMIVVYADITAPLYWWKEFDTYKVGTVANSCSTMHKIHEKEFTLEDFSYEKMNNYYVLKVVIEELNRFRNLYLEEKNKEFWYSMIQLLPTSYNQKRTVMLNYEVLSNIYKSRHNHKLDEWIEFCKTIETLPHSEFITQKFFEN